MKNTRWDAPNALPVLQEVGDEARSTEPEAVGTRDRWRPAPREHPLDRWTLRLGVAVATVITVYSYVVSATSLYALARDKAGLPWWQAPAVPVVADGVTLYGMVRVIARSRRRDRRGASFGWLLVLIGTGA